jgi:LL-H family phage holin
MFAEFINEYGMQLMYAIITAIAGYIGIVLKNLAKKYFNDKTKKEVAKNAVQFVEQVYHNLHGDEKLNEALKAASAMLAEKSITITDLELRVLVEAAVAEFNKAFEKTAEAPVKE